MCDRAFVVSERLRSGDAVASFFPPIAMHEQSGCGGNSGGTERTPDRVGTADTIVDWYLT
jgi:hypothetical protein